MKAKKKNVKDTNGTSLFSELIQVNYLDPIIIRGYVVVVSVGFIFLAYN